MPKNDLSSFSVTASKPALGSSYTYHVDVSLLVQDTGKVFGLVDENERQRGLQAPGLRGVVEVLKSRVSVSVPRCRQRAGADDSLRVHGLCSRR